DGRNTDIIHALTNVMVRVNETIRIEESDGRVFSGYVAQDVLGRNKNLIIPRGSNVEMVVRTTSDNELALDLDSIVIFGRRYGLQTEDNFGANKRTAECFVGIAGPRNVRRRCSNSDARKIHRCSCRVTDYVSACAAFEGRCRRIRLPARQPSLPSLYESEGQRFESSRAYRTTNDLGRLCRRPAPILFS